MGKGNNASAVNVLGRRRRNLQDYFYVNPAHFMTPKQRSLPKDKKLFHNRDKGKSTHKDRMVKKRRNGSPHRVTRLAANPSSNRNDGHRLDLLPNHQHPNSIHKASRLYHSLNKEYDSPSKDQDYMDFIFKGAAKKVKGGTAIYSVVTKVNYHLRCNRMQYGITVLTEALKGYPHNYYLVYLLGICYIFTGSYEQAINLFDGLLRAKPRKNIYLLLSVCYKKTEEFVKTEAVVLDVLLYLEECIRRFPKYYEAYIYRGKLYLKLKQYKKALVDFEKANMLEPVKQMGLIGKGDCLRLMERYKEAKAAYSQAHTKKNEVSLLLRQAICSMYLHNLGEALEDINKLLYTYHDNSYALYFKGLILNKQKYQNYAIICYYQAIKYNTNKRAVTRSIYYITKIKIENRDYYYALYTLYRAQYLDIDYRVINKFKIFTDGVTSMMKKNYTEGIAKLTYLLTDQDKPLSNFLKPLFYSTRSYGFIATEKFQQAKEDLDAMERDFSLDLPNLYNKFICEGILSCNSQKYEQALSFFSKAGKALPYRIEPAFYKAVTLICFLMKFIPKEMKYRRKYYLYSAMRTINKVYAPIENNPSLYLVRGLLHFATGDLNTAFGDLYTCWRESTKQNPLVSYLIAIIYAEMGNYNSAIEYFKRTIEHDYKHQVPEAYLNRAKCMLLTGEVNNGFIDLQSYMAHRPSSPYIHIWAGHLLFYIGAFDDAAKAYSNINNISRNFYVLSYRAKCYLICKDVMNTINNLKQMLEIKYDSRTYFDYQMLEALSECNNESLADYTSIRNIMKETKKKTSLGNYCFGNFFYEGDYQFFKAVMYFYDGKYVEAAKNFRRSLDLTETMVKAKGYHDTYQLDFYKLSFTNRTYNYFYIIWNIAVCEIMQNNLSKASKLLKSILDKLTETNIKYELYLFINLLANEILYKGNTRRQQYYSTDDPEYVELALFPIYDRLCSIFPDFVLPLHPKVRTRIYFCLPYVERPDITPKFYERIFEYISMATIEIKPEAPWIKRSEQGIIFTDYVIKYDIELSESSSEPSRSVTREDNEEGIDAYEEEEDEYKEHEEEYEYYYEEYERASRPAFDPSQLKDLLRLDRKTEYRLAKLKQNQS